MTSPIIPASGFTGINTTTDGGVIDLPVGEWPTMTRIQPSDLVGPTAANRQHKAIQRRLETVAGRFDAVMLGLNRITGATAVGSNRAQRSHEWFDSPIVLPPTAGAPDGMDYYLPRDGSAMLWGRLSLGNTRTLLYGFDGLGIHWIQGPANAAYGGSGPTDTDLILGVERVGVSDYRLTLMVDGAPQRLATLVDVATGGGTLTLAGDVSGTAAATSVDKVQGITPGTSGLDVLAANTDAAARSAIGTDAAGAPRPPTGSAGGDLGGSYPNPTVPALANVSRNACGTRYVNTGTPPAGTGVDGDIWYQVI